MVQVSVLTPVIALSLRLRTGTGAVSTMRLVVGAVDKRHRKSCYPHYFYMMPPDKDRKVRVKSDLGRVYKGPALVLYSSHISE